MQRLDRILSEAGVASRKELRAIIRAGRVTADGAVVTDESRKFDEAAVHIAVDGQPVRLRGPVLIMLHKPAGYLTAADDPKAKTVMELVPDEYRRLGVMPVGRLDKDTEGLLLLTNDGDLTYKLTHPKHDVEKTYIAKLYGVPDEGALQKFRRGVVIDGRKTKPAKIQILEREKDGRFCTAEIVIHEGRNRQVRKMCESIKHPVAQLQRVATGELTLGDLPKGKYRHLTEKEIRYLKRL